MSKILVVDDEEALLELVSAILRSEGFSVKTAESGPKALEQLDQERFDLVLLDVMMPDMDGWAVVKEIKSRAHLHELPIAMLTVKTMSPEYFYSDDVEGLVDYINKPFSKQELVDRVKKILSEVGRIDEVKKGLELAAPDFMGEYEELARTERLYENLLKSMELSLIRMDGKTRDYKLIKDALDYGKVLLKQVRERKKEYEKLISEK